MINWWKQKSEQVRAKREAKDKELALSPSSILIRDQKKIRSEIKKWERVKESAFEQLNKLKELYEQTKTATRFHSSASNEIKEALKDPQNWKDYPEMNYVNDLGALY